MLQLQERDVQMQEVLQQMSSVQDQSMQLSQVGSVVDFLGSRRIRFHAAGPQRQTDAA
jgi:hypothetical protein